MAAGLAEESFKDKFFITARGLAGCGEGGYGLGEEAEAAQGLGFQVQGPRLAGGAGLLNGGERLGEFSGVQQVFYFFQVHISF